MRNSKQHANRAEFLNAVRKECALHLEPKVAEVVLAEVNTHLSDSVEALIELGHAREEAEAIAVRSFHNPKKFVRAMGHVHNSEVLHDRFLLMIGILLLCWMGFYMEIAPKHITWMVAPLGLLLLGAAMLIRTLQLGSPRLGTLRRLALVAFVVIGVISPLRTINLWAYGGAGYMPLGMARQAAEDPGGFIQSSLTEGDWATTYVGDIEELSQHDTEPARRALAAPLAERYISNLPETIPSLIFCLGLLLVTHLLPVALKRRKRYRSQQLLSS